MGRIIQSRNAARYLLRAIYYCAERKDRGFADGIETRKEESLFSISLGSCHLLGHGLNPGTAENVRNEEKKEEQATKIRATR
jgi:hypothetical protein